jgi:hypothetical protein
MIAIPKFYKTNIQTTLNHAYPQSNQLQQSVRGTNRLKLSQQLIQIYLKNLSMRYRRKI